MKNKVEYNPYKMINSGSFGSRNSMMSRAESIKEKRRHMGAKVEESIKKLSRGMGKKNCSCVGGCSCGSNKKVTITIVIIVILAILALIGVYVGFRFIRKEFGNIKVERYPEDFKYPKMK